MNIANIEAELHKIQALVGRWSEQGYVPSIEKNIALQRVQKFYELFLDLDTQPQIEYRSEPIVTPDPAKSQQEPREKPRPQEQFEESSAQQGVEDSDAVEYVEVDRRVEDYATSSHSARARFSIFGIEISPEQKERFTHDLFCNDPLVFHNEISKIERLRSIDEVLIYIGEKYAWAPENPSAEEFVDLIVRAF